MPTHQSRSRVPRVSAGPAVASAGAAAAAAVAIWLAGSWLIATVGLTDSATLGSGPQAVGLLALVSLGTPVTLGQGVDAATLHPHLMALHNPALLALAVGPLLAGLLLGLLSERRSTADGSRLAPIWSLAGLLWAAVASGLSMVPVAPVVPAQADPGWAFLLALGWAGLAGGLGVALARAHRRSRARVSLSARRRPRVAVATTVALIASLGAVAPAAGSDSGAELAVMSNSALSSLRPGVAGAVRAAAATQMLSHAVANQAYGTVGFATLSSPLRGTADNWLSSNAALLGLADAGSLRLTSVVTDQSGVHRHYQQVQDGVPVYSAAVVVHLDASQSRVLAVSNSSVPDLDAVPTHPTVSRKVAERAAREAAPAGAKRMGPTRLRVSGGRLVWLVWLGKPGYSSLFFVSARGDALVTHVENRIREGLNRNVYDAANTRNLPGTLVRGEGGAPTGIADANGAYDFTGATYAYYAATFGRDGFDNTGKPLISTVRFGSGYQNAYWDGSQMVYGDNMVTMDVTAHEYTHAVTDWTSELEYRNQSGALNESFSDMMGVMAEGRAEGAVDWLLGEGSALGVIRSMADPTLYGQPAHLSNYSTTCSDNGGVHTNSGIPNKAFYNVTTAIGSAAAERIFYTAFTGFLTSKSGFNEAREATRSVTSSLYPGDAAKYNAVTAGWDAVGVDGSAEPPEPDCGCSANVALSGSGLAGLKAAGPSVGEIRSSLYQLRDTVLAESPSGEHYQKAYDQNTGRISQLLKGNAKLRKETSRTLQVLTPAMVALAEGRADEQKVTRAQAKRIVALAKHMKAAAKRSGDLALRSAVTKELRLLNPASLVGKSYAEAQRLLDLRVSRAQAEGAQS